MPTDARREQLLDAALAIIARQGYAAVSVEAIAREVDVTRPVVYNVFDDLDALLRALLDRQERRALDQLSARIAMPADLADLGGYLGSVIRDLVAMVRADPLTWTPIFLPVTGTPGAVRGRIERDREIVRKRMQNLVGAAAVMGVIPAAIDAEVASHALIGLGEYFGRLLLERPDAVDVDRLVSTLTAVVGLGS